MTAGAFSIGSQKWPGISKLIEETGDVQQVCGKLIATNGETAHWDGCNLKERLEEEIADAMAACAFVMEANGLDAERVCDRADRKLALFKKWHAEQGGV